MRRIAMMGLLAWVFGILPGCQSVWERRPVVRAYIVHHAAGVFKKLVPEFERETGIRVDATYACRRNMYQILSTNRDGDLYVTSSPANLEKAKQDGLTVGPVVTVGELVPVIEVARGNPKRIMGLADLAKPGVRLCLGSEKACMGRVTDKILAKNNLAEKIAPNILSRIKGEVNIAKSVDGEKVDATIVWLSTIYDVGDPLTGAVPIPAEQNVIDPIGAVVLNTGKHAAGAQRLLGFIGSPKAQKILAEGGLKRGL